MRLILCLSLLFCGFAQAEPPEQSSRVVSRTVQDGLRLSTELSKNHYKQVPYQANYTEQVPYQTTETYYEQVPYQEQESYIDYVTDYRSERVCHRVGGGSRRECRTENECRTEQECHQGGSRRECRTNRVCNNVGGGQQCRNVEECGVNALGERVCKNRQVCENTPGRQECRDEQQCYDVPGERQCSNRQVCTPRQHCYDVPNPDREECSMQQVPYQRAVTKYRTVTKYRQEARTRTVTKYREETRCCVTKYREEFDRQQVVEVVINFPREAILLVDEREQIEVQLTGNENNPSVKLIMRDTVLGYRVLDQKRSGRTITVTLGLVPKYQGSELGEQTITRIELVLEDGSARLEIQDAGVVKRVQSIYEAQILDRSGLVVATAQGASMNVQHVVLPLQNDLIDDEYQIVLNVKRMGLVLAAPIEFNKTVEHMGGQLDHHVYADPARIDSLDLKGLTTDARFLIRDLAPKHHSVETSVKVVLKQRNKLLGSREFKLEEQVADHQGVVSQSLLTDFKIPARTLESALQPGKEVTVEVTVTRKSLKLNNGQPLLVLQKTFIDKNR